MDLAQAIVQLRQRGRRAAWTTAIAQGSASGGWVEINASGGIERALCPDYVSPSAGDVLAVARAASPIVIGILALSSDPTPDLGPESPDITPDSGVTRFPALFSWTWERDKPEGQLPTAWRFSRDSRVRQGNSWPGALPVRHGYWFWNWSVTNALHGVTVDSAKIRLPRSVDGPESADVTLVFRGLNTLWPTQSSQTGVDGNPVPDEPGNVGTAVTFTSAAIGRGGATWTDLSASSVQYLVNAYNGSGTAGSPYIPPPNIGIVGADNITLQGVEDDPMSGLLEISWHR